jgi:Sulfotransferase family
MPSYTEPSACLLAYREAWVCMGRCASIDRFSYGATATITGTALASFTMGEGQPTGCRQSSCLHKMLAWDGCDGLSNNAIVLGAGRSGTSLLAGLFHNPNYFLGERLWPATVSNPLGYFEDSEINSINEDLLDKVVPWRPRGLAGAIIPFFRSRTRWSQRWLAVVPEGTEVQSDSILDTRMAAQTVRQPYLFKDPRFSYTLTAWRKQLADDTIFLCTFRDPHHTVNSIMKIVRTERYLRDLRITPQMAYQYWEAIYRSVLRQEEVIGGTWLFIHYNELLTGRAIPLLEDHLGVPANPAMIRPDLNRSAIDGHVDSSTNNLCRVLLDLAEQKYHVTGLAWEITTGAPC